MNRKISVIGLGAGALDQLTLGVYKRLKEASVVYLRTKEHPVVSELVSEGITFESFDDIYESHDGFEEVYQEITSVLINKAIDNNVVYAVPGHPIVAERTVQLLLEAGEQQQIEVSIDGGQSFIDSLFTAVKVDPIEGFQLLDGTALSENQLKSTQHVIIGQVYDGFVASDVKLTLMEKYPDEHMVYYVTAAGTSTEQVTKVPLYEMDHHIQLNNLTSLYVPPLAELRSQEIERLHDIVAILRGPEGCPWDQKQTHQTLKKHLIEESYELLDAIDKDDIDGMIEELGDVLLQVMMHAQLGEEEGYFSIKDVIQSISDKMIRRHPHVFGDQTAHTTADVMSIWNEEKKKEKEQSSSILDDIPQSFPALLKAQSVQKKAASIGFDFETVEDAWKKVEEEINEFKVEWKQENKKAQLQEIGDIYFALTNVARLLSISSEEALTSTNEKFMSRFKYIEQAIANSQQPNASLTLEELDVLWTEAKKQE